MFREAFMRIGAEFLRIGWLGDVEDIFFLEYEEIFSAIRKGEAGSSLNDLVKSVRTITSAPIGFASIRYLWGKPATKFRMLLLLSLRVFRLRAGQYEGVVCVVKGYSAIFQKVTDGCVLVIPYSDVSWTPFFARAGAIIAEAGGILSHSSIVAREYGIPAIVSVPHATRLTTALR